MNVCMITYSFYESDTRVMRYAEALSQRGDHVDVIAIRREGQPAVGVLDGVNVFHVQARPAGENGRLLYVLRVIMFFLRSMVLVSRKHLGRAYDIVHVHSVPDFLVFAAWIPKLLGAGIILDIHDLLPEFYGSKYGVKQSSWSFRALLLIERVSGRFADHVIAANDLWGQRLAKRSLPNAKCTTMVNLPDKKIFYRRGRAREGNRFLMLYPGTLNWHQGLDIAIRAFACIKDECLCAEFHIYGEGPCRSSLEQLASELGLDNRVIFKAFVPTREIATIMENADLGIVPKRNEGFGNEAFSTKIMEFMALGVPVLVSDTQVDRYYFDESVVKFFPAADEQKLAESMLELMRDPGLRQRLARSADEFVGRNNWESLKAKYLGLVDHLANRKNSAVSDRGPADHIDAANAG